MGVMSLLICLLILPAWIYLCLPLCLNICLTVSRFVCMYLTFSVCMFVRLFVCLYISFSIRISLSLSVDLLTLFPSVYLYFYLSVFLSVSLSFACLCQSVSLSFKLSYYSICQPASISIWKCGMHLCFGYFTNLIIIWHYSDGTVSQPILLASAIHAYTGNTKGESITVPLTSCLISLELAVWQLIFFLFLFAKQTNPNQSNRRSIVQWYFTL